MGATTAKARADLRHRKLQGGVIGLVLLLATAAATLALSILVESHAPFQRAFEAANGAHLIVDYAGTVPADQLARTGTATGVTASAGPWPVVPGGLAHPKGGQIRGQVFSGRPLPDATIDAVTIEAGRWWQAPGEAVLDQDAAAILDKHVGDSVDLYPGFAVAKGPGSPAPAPDLPPRTLRVVGIAASVSTPGVAAWISPTDVAALSPSGPPEQEMLYRVQPAATDADLAAARAAITRDLPPGAVVRSSTYFELQAGVDRIADLYVPVLLAFAVFALLAAAFTIANVISGIVLTSYREIGVMKAIGFTPAQVSSILLAQVLVPVVVGGVLGVVVGTIGSQPILAETAMSFGLPAAATVSVQVIATVLLVAVATTILAALGPSLAAGRISAVAAMSRGAAPSDRADGGRLRRFGLRLPLPLPIRLGISAGLAHPLRATMTLGALLVGVAAITFSVGLNASLVRVVDDINRNVASPVRAELMSPTLPAGEVSTAIAADPDTGASVAIATTTVAVPGLGPVPFRGYDGDSSWLGYAVIHGRWSTAPGEAVAATVFFTESGLHVGDTVTLAGPGGFVDVKLVGEVFDIAKRDEGGFGLDGSFADARTLDPALQPDRWELRPTAGVEARGYANHLEETLAHGARFFVAGDSSNDESLLLFLSVIATFGTVLVAISLGGVFNTVLLETRQRTRELAVLKAVGVTPVQVIGLVVASIVPVGVLAGLLGVPLGLGAQHVVLTYMGQVAAKTAIPDSVFAVFTPGAFIGLGLAGLAIGVVGAFLPAQRAARLPIAPVLQAE